MPITRADVLAQARSLVDRAEEELVAARARDKASSTADTKAAVAVADRRVRKAQAQAEITRYDVARDDLLDRLLNVVTPTQAGLALRPDIVQLGVDPVHPDDRALADGDEEALITLALRRAGISPPPGWEPSPVRDADPTSVRRGLL